MLLGRCQIYSWRLLGDRGCETTSPDLAAVDWRRVRLNSRCSECIRDAIAHPCPQTSHNVPGAHLHTNFQHPAALLRGGSTRLSQTQSADWPPMFVSLLVSRTEARG